MTKETAKTNVLMGGEFLIKETNPHSVFIPEEFSEEQKMMISAARDFLNKEIVPNVEAIDKQEEGLTARLLDKAGEVGLLGVAVPEEYGGLGEDFNTNTGISLELGAGFSWSVSFAAHTGIGTLPILYYGTDDQKKKYLPKLASGELKSAYCLTEPTSGSDALSAKTTAVLSSDSKYYILNGQKMWITNGGFADILITFAQVEGDKFTCFIIDAKSEGFNRGKEENKMGIKGSSTRALFLDNVKVPVENILGERPIAPGLITLYLCLGAMPHANVSWSFGPLGKILVSPAYHRIHHSIDGPVDVNLGIVFVFCDVLAGRAMFPERGSARPSRRTGLAGRPVAVEQAATRSRVAGVFARQLLEPFDARAHY